MLAYVLMRLLTTSAKAIRDGLGAEIKLKEGKRKLKIGFVFARDCRAHVVYRGKFSWHAVSLRSLLLHARVDICVVSSRGRRAALHAARRLEEVSCFYILRLRTD